LAVTDTEDGPRLARCQRELCFEIPIPTAARGPFGGVFAYGDGFCVGLETHALWCRAPEDTWIRIVFDDDTASRHHLGPRDRWSILDAREVEPGTWLLAIANETGGYLAMQRGDEPTLLMATGLKWAQGAVLLESADDAVAIGLEVDGPVSLRLTGGRITVPGSLYP